MQCSRRAETRFQGEAVVEYERAKKALGRRSRSLDVPIAVVSAGAVILVGPLRGVFDAYPIVPFAGTLFLFVMPGLLLAHRFLGDHFSGAALVPVSFVISSGVFGLLGVPVLMAHLSRSEEHTSELQSHSDLVCRLLLEKKKKKKICLFALKKKKKKK